MNERHSKHNPAEKTIETIEVVIMVLKGFELVLIEIDGLYWWDVQSYWNNA